MSISFIKEIKAESYLDEYLKECAEKIMEKAMSEYYSLIPNGDYMNQYIEECAIKIIESGYGSNCNIVRDTINSSIDISMLQKIYFRMENYYAEIIEKLRDDVLKCEIEQQGISLE